jgi:hypothetical protein
MKITIDNIIDFMKNKQNLIISNKQVKEIKKHFYKDVEKLVYWSFTESNRYYDIKLEGIITKKFYEKITKDEYKNKKYSFGEVIDNMGDAGDVTSAQPAYYVTTIRNSCDKCKDIF